MLVCASPEAVVIQQTGAFGRWRELLEAGLKPVKIVRREKVTEKLRVVMEAMRPTSATSLYKLLLRPPLPRHGFGTRDLKDMSDADIARHFVPRSAWGSRSE
jgi:hypothetical protein